MKDPRTKESRGFAFVTFQEVGPAEEAIQALNATTLDGRTILVEKAKRGRARTRRFAVFTGQLRLTNGTKLMPVLAIATPGQYQGPEKNRINDFGGRGGYGGDRRGPPGGRDYGGPPPRRYDDRDDRRGPPGPPRGGGGDRDRDYGGSRRYDDRPPRRDLDDRGPPRRDFDDRAPPRRDYDRRDEEPRRERREYTRDDAPPRRY